MATPKPIILPDTFSGDSNSSWDQWIIHFNYCAEVNGWEVAMKLSFLKVRLTGQAQTVFQRLSEEDRSSFDNAVLALKARFEPDSKRELYLAEFSTRKRTISESWANYTEDLRRLFTKAYPDLDSKATEQIALTQFISSITDIQISFAVKQKAPKTLDEAVTTTMHLESYMVTSRGKNDAEDLPASSVTHNSSDEKLMLLIEQLSDKITKLEEEMNTPHPRRQQPSPPSRSIICFNCQQPGHLARSCPAPWRPTWRPRRKPFQGNEKPSVQ